MKKLISILSITGFCLFLISLVASTPWPWNVNTEVAVEQEKKILYPNKEENVLVTNYFVDGLSVNAVVSFCNENEYLKVQKFYNGITNNKEITDTIIKYCIEYEVPINLGFALAFRESKFNNRAWRYNKSSGTHDGGLFQLNTGSRGWKKEEYFNIDKNTKNGVSFLSFLLNKYSDVDLALSAYNAGTGRVDKEHIPYTTAIHTFSIRGYERELDKKFSIILLPTLEYVSMR